MFVKQLGYFADPPNVFFSIFIVESEIVFVGERAFSGAGNPGKPEYFGRMAVALSAFLQGDVPGRPNGIGPIYSFSLWLLFVIPRQATSANTLSILLK